MELLSKVKEIIKNNEFDYSSILEKYENVYEFTKINSIDCEKYFEHETINDSFLIHKYENNIPEGFYGFSIGSPTPKNWFEIIDNVLELLLTNDPNLEICQIKMKFGGIRFYVHSDVIEDIFEIEKYIEDVLHDNKFVY